MKISDILNSIYLILLFLLKFFYKKKFVLKKKFLLMRSLKKKDTNGTSIGKKKQVQ